jgi:hypothetical protein
MKINIHEILEYEMVQGHVLTRGYRRDHMLTLDIDRQVVL